MSFTPKNKTYNVSRYWKLEEYSNEEVLEQIKNFTNEFKNLDDNFTNSLKKNIENEEIIFRGFIRPPKDSNIVKLIIGKNGKWFKKTTLDCNIHFIWHDYDSQTFYLWGQKYPLIKALNRLWYRCKDQTKKYFSNKDTPQLKSENDEKNLTSNNNDDDNLEKNKTENKTSNDISPNLSALEKAKLRLKQKQKN